MKNDDSNTRANNVGRHCRLSRRRERELVWSIGNKSVPKIIMNNTINLFIFRTAISILLISDRNSFRVLFGKIASCILFKKYIYILALEMASPGNQHCANRIGTLLFLRNSKHPQPIRYFSSVILNFDLWPWVLTSECGLDRSSWPDMPE